MHVKGKGRKLFKHRHSEWLVKKKQRGGEAYVLACACKLGERRVRGTTNPGRGAMALQQDLEKQGPVGNF